MNKIEVFACTGCGIGEVLDMEELEEIPDEEGYNFKTHPCLCNKEGVELLKNTIEEKSLEGVVIGACSRRVNFDIFKFDNCVVERVNLREGVVWPHPRDTYPIVTEEQKDDEEHFDQIQMKANDYIQMGMKRLENIKPVEPFKLEAFTKKILVLGGGVTGMSAALDASKAGYDVTIIEKQDKLGGYVANMRSQMPVAEPFENLITPVTEKLIAEVEAASNIEVKTTTEVARIAGQPGDFTVTLKKPGEKIPFDVPFPLPEEMLIDENGKELDAEAQHEKYLEYNEGREDILTFDPDGAKFGAVILAAGWRPSAIEGEEFAHLGVDLPDVVTNDEFEKIAAKGKITRPSDGKEAKSVVFIQSPGKDEDDSDFEYCGSVTSQVALKQAQYVRDDYEDGKAYVVYQHMRTPGLQEYYYKSMQQNDGIFLTKGAVQEVKEGNGGLVVNATNTLLGDNLALQADMVVVAAGMTPVTADDPVVNLAYRQGPGFRDNGIYAEYADSNYICFPYETQRTGIYAAGAVRRSMTIEESIEDATGAALKAIQCIESSNKGVAVHPRSGDMTFPDFFFQRCTQCKRCTVECPFGALDDDAKGTPMVNPTRCRRCGTCMGACPERIISFADYSPNSVGAQIKGLQIPSEDDYEEPPLRILALICENDALPALDMVGMNRIDYSPNYRFIPVRCLGSVNTIWIKDALAAGMDGAILIGCKKGDDYQCHFVKGSELAEVRVSKISDALSSLALETERVRYEEIAIDEYNKLPEILNSFAEEIEDMGPNPFKGF
jgi:quinone-modifying oxidoreductase, subunit QmoB